MVPRGGIEPPTQGFSEYCATKDPYKQRVLAGQKLVCEIVCVISYLIFIKISQSSLGSESGCEHKINLSSF